MSGPPESLQGVQSHKFLSILFSGLTKHFPKQSEVPAGTSTQLEQINAETVLWHKCFCMAHIINELGTSSLQILWPSKIVPGNSNHAWNKSHLWRPIYAEGMLSTPPYKQTRETILETWSSPLPSCVLSGFEIWSDIPEPLRGPCTVQKILNYHSSMIQKPK